MTKYALNNSYFKNRRPNDPQTLSQIVAYHRERGELPFRYDGDNWTYDTVCERQKRAGVVWCQHLTPDAAAGRIASLALEYAASPRAVLDACCGTGQLTRVLRQVGFFVAAFDIDPEMIAVHNYLYPDVEADVADFRELREGNLWNCIVSNPPFDRAIGPVFMQWLADALEVGGVAIVLLPNGYVDKTSPKSLAESLSKMKISHREDVRAQFAHTRVSCEIVVLQKIRN